MSNILEVSEFTFLHILEKELKTLTQEDKEFQIGIFDAQRIVNLFDNTARLLIKWSQDSDSEAIELGSIKIQDITNEKKVVAYKVILKFGDEFETLIAQINSENEICEEAKYALKYIKLLTKIALMTSGGDAIKFESDPKVELKTLRKSVVANNTIASAVASVESGTTDT